MSVKRRFSTRWGHPYHRQGACTECRQTLLHPLCSITPMTPEGYTEYSAQSKREDTPAGIHTPWFWLHWQVRLKLCQEVRNAGEAGHAHLGASRVGLLLTQGI